MMNEGTIETKTTRVLLITAVVCTHLCLVNCFRLARMNPMVNTRAVINVSTRVRSERNVALVPKNPGVVRKSDIGPMYGSNINWRDNCIILNII